VTVYLGVLADEVSDQLLLEAGEVGDTVDAQALCAHRVPYVSRQLCTGGLHTADRFGMHVGRVVQRQVNRSPIAIGDWWMGNR
jgi:hypothetical protein